MRDFKVGDRVAWVGLSGDTRTGEVVEMAGANLCIVKPNGGGKELYLCHPSDPRASCRQRLLDETTSRPEGPREFRVGDEVEWEGAIGKRQPWVPRWNLDEDRGGSGQWFRGEVHKLFAGSAFVAFSDEPGSGWLWPLPGDTCYAPNRPGGLRHARPHAGSESVFTPRTVEVHDLGLLVEMMAVGGSSRRADRVFTRTGRPVGGWDLFEDADNFSTNVRKTNVGWDEATAWVLDGKVGE